MDPEWTFDADSKWSATSDWDYGAFLGTLFTYTGDYAKPPSMSYATNPDSFLLRSPYAHPNAYPAPPTETKFVTETFTWEHRSWVPARGDRNDATDDTTFNVMVVSPQGWVGNPYGDLAARFTLGGGGKQIIESSGTQTTARGDITHVIGQHTVKTGIEYIGRDLEYLQEESSGLFESGVGGGRNSQMLTLWNYPASQPKIRNISTIQVRSDGMIANLVSVLNGRPIIPTWFYSDMFNIVAWAKRKPILFRRCL